MNRFALLTLCAFIAPLPVKAETPIWSAEDARKAMQLGEALVLDIRSPEEWKETGLAEGALPVSMHTRDFGQNLQSLMNTAKKTGRPIAMICATGGRTKQVTDILRKNGITGVIDVSEGMMGNHRGKGWIAKGLPVVDLDTAQAALDALQK